MLEGAELIYYAVRDFTGERPADRLLRATRQTILRLIADYRPSILAYEKTFYVQSKNSALLQVQEAEIKRVGHSERLRVVGYSPTRARKLLCQNGRATRQAVAEILVRRFPELARYRLNRAGRREEYWLNMFDAMAVAVVCAAESGRTGRARDSGVEK